MSAVDVVEEVYSGMRTPLSTISIGARLQAVMAELRPVGKDSKSEGGFTFNYRGIDAVINEISPLFAKNGVIVSKSYSASNYTSFTSSKGSELHRCSVNVTFRYTAAHDVLDYLEDSVVAEAMDSGDKATAKAMSVALRTSLIQVLLIPTGDTDADADQYTTQRHQTPNVREGATMPEDSPEAERRERQSWSERAWNGMVQNNEANREITHIAEGVSIVKDQYHTAPSHQTPVCDHGEMARKVGTSKTGNPYMGYVCDSKPQCPAVWYEIDKATGFWRPRA